MSRAVGPLDEFVQTVPNRSGRHVPAYRYYRNTYLARGFLAAATAACAFACLPFAGAAAAPLLGIYAFCRGAIALGILQTPIPWRASIHRRTLWKTQPREPCPYGRARRAVTRCAGLSLRWLSSRIYYRKCRPANANSASPAMMAEIPYIKKARERRL